MRSPRLLVAALGLGLLLPGCARVKWTTPDRITGGMWMIKERRPFGGDTIYYCPPAVNGTVACQEASP